MMRGMIRVRASVEQSMVPGYSVQRTWRVFAKPHRLHAYDITCSLHPARQSVAFSAMFDSASPDICLAHLAIQVEVAVGFLDFAPTGDRPQLLQTAIIGAPSSGCGRPPLLPLPTTSSHVFSWTWFTLLQDSRSISIINPLPSPHACLRHQKLLHTSQLPGFLPFAGRCAPLIVCRQSWLHLSSRLV